MNPTPITREVSCVANADVAVTFDITLARQAEQGFFDVAVQFSDLFCSAKLDCETASGADLELLHNAAGARDMTIVLGFACTGSITGTPTFLYMDDPVIKCGEPLTEVVRVDPTGLGNVPLSAPPSYNEGGYLFGAAVYRGVEGFAGKAYWNVSFGLDALRFGTQACVLSGRATASAGGWAQAQAGFALPAGSVYPVIDWAVPIWDAGGRACHKHQVNVAASGVTTDYYGYLPLLNGFTWSPDPIYLQHRYEPAAHGGAGEVLSAGEPICTPSCGPGRCVATNDCQCDGTGYGGDYCDQPLCSAECVNGGVCTAPEHCTCPDGFWGETCAGVCAAGACAGTMRCDQGTGAASACVGGCVPGAYGATCAEACTPVAHCAVTPTCHDATDSVCAACVEGYLLDGSGACVACLGAGDCADVAGDCFVSACEAGACVANPLGAGAACGDPTVTECTGADTCDGAGVCLANHASVGSSCGDAGGACVNQDTCDGAGGGTDNGFAASGVPCGSGDDSACDKPDTCDGGGGCLPNLEPATTVCRESAGVCDVVERCDGAGACPSDGFLSSATVCRAASASGCDVAEQCTGGAAACPADGFKAAGTSCGSGASSTCDLPDTCSAGGVCQPNYASGGTSCGDGVATACTAPDSCDGAGSCLANHAADGAACSNGVFCDGAETCSAGTCAGHDAPCTPSTSVCDEANDVCVPIYTSCLDARNANETVSGSYYIDPDLTGPNAMIVAYCDMVTDGGGWTLVRRVRPNGGGWLNPNDNLAGATASGTYQPSPTVNATFSMKFDTLTFTHFLFRTGDGVKWLITHRSQVYTGWDGTQPASCAIVKSSSSATATSALWYKRSGQPEDPWISPDSHGTGPTSAGSDNDTYSMLYGEGGYVGWLHWVNYRNGANVWVR